MKKKIDTFNSIIYKSDLNDIPEAIPYIEQNGYFSDTEDFSTYHYGELNEVYASYHHEYAYFGIGNDFQTAFKYFAPESSIVFVKDKRPYCFIDELPFKLGDEVELRSISTKRINRYKFVGYSVKLDETLDVILDKIKLVIVGLQNGADITPEELMKYEIHIKDEWQSLSVDA